MSNGADTRLRRTRARIIDAAEEVFPEHGFLGASMDAVAERASVSKQTVCAHFNNKEALFLEVVQSMTAEAASEIGEDRGDSEVFSEPSARICLTDIALDQLRVVLTPRLMRLRRMIIGEVDRFPMLGKSLHETGPRRSIQRLTRAISHYSATGALNASDPEKAAVLHLMDAQHLTFPDGAFDEAVATFVFCSVSDPVTGLREARRVTRPGGRLRLLEHQRADADGLARVMDRLDGPLHRLSGVHVARHTVENVRAAGWVVDRNERLGPLGVFRRITAHNPR